MPAAERGKPNPGFFLDTNVLVYAFSAQDAAKRETARALAESRGAWVSPQVLSELGNVLTRRFDVPAREARERVASIAAGCEVIMPCCHSRLCNHHRNSLHEKKRRGPWWCCTIPPSSPRPDCSRQKCWRRCSDDER